MDHLDVHEARRVYMSPLVAVILPFMWAAIGSFVGGWIVAAGLLTWRAYQHGDPSTWQSALTFSGVVFALIYTLYYRRWVSWIDGVEERGRPKEYGFITEPELTTYERPTNKGKTLMFDHIHATPEQLRAVASKVLAGARPSFRNMTPLFGGSESAYASFRDDMAHKHYFELDEQNRVIVTEDGVNFFIAVLERDVTPLPHRNSSPDGAESTPHTRYTRYG